MKSRIANAHGLRQRMAQRGGNLPHPFAFHRALDHDRQQTFAERPDVPVDATLGSRRNGEPARDDGRDLVGDGQVDEPADVTQALEEDHAERQRPLAQRGFGHRLFESGDETAPFRTTGLGPIVAQVR